MSAPLRPPPPAGMLRRPPWRRFLRKFFRVAAVLVVGIPVFVVAAGAVGVGALLYGDLEGTVPSPRPRLKAEPSKVFLMGPDGQPGEQIGEFHQFETTKEMKPSDVPAVLKNAVVASEDQNFWQHKGFDPQGILRAAVTNYQSNRTVQGGSTITQQLIRERYLSREQTTERKFNEVLLATRFERDLIDKIARERNLDEADAEREAKEQILFEYLDTVYFGAGAYGVGAAAQAYFHKNVNDLTASEAALLVSIIPAPSKYSPRENLAVAEQRRKNVLREMSEQEDPFAPGGAAYKAPDPTTTTTAAPAPAADPNAPAADPNAPVDPNATPAPPPPTEATTTTTAPGGDRPKMLTQDQYESEAAQSIWYAAFGPPPQPQTVVYPPPPVEYGRYPYYLDYIRVYMLDKYGPDLLYRGGLTIIAAIDPRLQDLADTAVGNTLSGTSPPLEMSLVSVEPVTGQVKALVGGRDWNVSQVNLALGGTYGMQPGSSFKAFTVAKAFEEGYSADTEYAAPGVLYVPGCATGKCAIHGGTGGIISLRTATAQSVNTYFAQLVLDLGPDNVAELANRLGVTHITIPAKNPEGHYNLGLTLGAFEVSPLDMAAGFSVFANHGIKPGATPAAKILNSDGSVLEDNTGPHGKRVLNAAAADWTADLLRGPIESGAGTAHATAQIGRMAGGKTGTAQDYKAAWFVGFTPQLATAVWMGYSDTPKPLVGIKGVGQVFGGTWPARTWAAFMRPAHEGLPEIKFTKPGILPPPSSGIRHVPDDAEIPDLPHDCNQECVQLPVLTSPTLPPVEDPNNPGECLENCAEEETTTTTRPRTGAPTTIITVPKKEEP